MKANQIPSEILKDLESRFNGYQLPSEIKIRKNAKVHIAYANETKEHQYYVGVVYIKGESTRVLGFPMEQSFFKF